jgi:amino acid transporter
LALAVAIAGWALLGFESAGSIAEEVRQPERAIPRAMVFSLVCVAAVVSFSALSLILAVPNVGTRSYGADDDPVAATLTLYFGSAAFKSMLVLFVIGFVACLLSTQAAVSRVIWAFARNRALPCSAILVKLSAKDRLPVNAIFLTSIVAFAVLMFSLTSIYPTVVAFTTAGFYIAFAFPVLATAWTHMRGRWRDGPFHIGHLTAPVIYAASLWLIFEIVNIAWPRSPELPWYENWAVPVMGLLIAALGALVRRASPGDI